MERMTLNLSKRKKRYFVGTNKSGSHTSLVTYFLDFLKISKITK